MPTIYLASDKTNYVYNAMKKAKKNWFLHMQSPQPDGKYVAIIDELKEIMADTFEELDRKTRKYLIEEISPLNWEIDSEIQRRVLNNNLMCVCIKNLLCPCPQFILTGKCICRFHLKEKKKWLVVFTDITCPACPFTIKTTFKYAKTHPEYGFMVVNLSLQPDYFKIASTGIYYPKFELLPVPQVFLRIKDGDEYKWKFLLATELESEFNERDMDLLIELIDRRLKMNESEIEDVRRKLNEEFKKLYQ